MMFTQMISLLRSLLAIVLVATLSMITLHAGDGNAARGLAPTPPNAPQRMPGTLIMKLKSSVPNRRGAVRFQVAALDAALARIGAVERRPLFPLAPYPEVQELSDRGNGDRVGFDRVYVIRYTAPYDPLAAASELASTGLLEFAEPYYLFQLFYTPNDPLLTSQDWLNIVQARQAWDITKGDTSIAIGIIDTGVDWLHEDLNGNIRVNAGESGVDGQGNDKRSNGKDDDGNGQIDDYHGWDFVGNPTLEDFQTGSFRHDNNPAPRIQSTPGYQGYHGTVVSGCASGVADNGKGIAGTGFNTRLIPIKCAGDSIGTGSVVAGYDGIRYAADMGARVINCSWGGPVDGGNIQALQSLVNYAHSKGALVIAASGNFGTNNDLAPSYPANLKHVLSVGATTSRDSAANFSQYGVSVGVYAPGVAVYTTLPGDNYNNAVNGAPINGTSFSAPMVAGIAALVFAEHPDWDPDQVAMQLRVTGDRIRIRQELAPYFYRRANAYRAVALNRTLDAGDPTGVPGVGINGYTINGRATDTIKALDQSVRVQLTLKNYLSPVSDLKVEAVDGQTLSIVSPVTISSLGTMQSSTHEIDVKLNENNTIVYSEGNLQLVLKLTAENYEDYVAVLIPVHLPGWHQQVDPLATNQFVTFQGSGITSVTPKIAWTVANVQTSQTSLTPVVSRTVNGSTWSNFQQVVQGEPIYCIAARSDRRAWAGSGPTSRQAAIFRTTNGGGSWQRTSVAAITPFVNAVHFFDDENGILIGDPMNSRWGIGATSDGGATWTAISTPLLPGGAAEAGWNGSFCALGDNLWFGTNNSRIYRSTDRGRTWSFGTTPSINSFGVSFATPQDGLATFNPQASGGGSEMIAVTHNGGATWTQVGLPFTGAHPQSVAFVPGTTRAFVGTQNGVFETSDFGATWKRMAMPPMIMNGLILTAQSNAEGEVGAYGTNLYSQLMTFKDLDATQLAVPDALASPLAGASATLYQNVPNPFTGATSISFELRAAADVRITMHDLLGMQVRHVTPGRMEAGLHTIELSCEDLPTGSYFYTLHAGSEMLTKRMSITR